MEEKSLITSRFIGRQKGWRLFAAAELRVGRSEIAKHMDRQQSWSKVVLWGAVAWVIIAGLALVQLWPIVPVPFAQWVIFIVLAPPIYVVAAAAFGWVFSEKHGNSISRQKFSLLRVLVAFPLVLGVFFLGWWVAGMFK